MTEKATLVEDQVASLLARGDDNPRDLGHRLGDLLRQDRRGFQQAAVKYLLAAEQSPAARIVVWLLEKEGMLPGILLSPSVCSLDESVFLARVIHTNVDQIDVQLAKALKGAHESQALRILRLLAVVVQNNRTLPLLIRSLRDRSPELRSNTALIFARHCQNEIFVANVMRDPNPAVRASALEGLGMADRTPDPEVLSEAFSDPNPRVQANAILAYRRIDENAAFEKLEEMARHQNGDFQAAAAWAMGETQAPRFLSTLKRMQQDRTSEVRRKADEALGKIPADESSIPSAVPQESAGLAAFTIEPLYAVADETSLRRLHLAVTDSEGFAVAGLSHQDFQLQEDGGSVNGQEVFGPEQSDPAAIAWVLDCSGSMSASAIQEMNTAVIKSLRHKRRDDRVAIVKFSMDVERAVGLTDNLKLLKAVVQRKHMGMRTSSRLHDAVERAFEEVAGQGAGCRAVIAIADGPDRGSESNFSDIVRRARDIAAPLYVVGFGAEARTGSLPDLADPTGGRFFSTEGGDELASVCVELMRKISARYTVTYHGSDSYPEAIRVRVTTQSGRGETSVSPLGPWS